MKTSWSSPFDMRGRLHHCICLSHVSQKTGGEGDKGRGPRELGWGGSGGGGGGVVHV